MKKTIFICSGNAILFLLLGLAFAFPADEVQLIEGAGFGAAVSVFPLLLLGYLMVYPLCFYVLKKLFGWHGPSDSELSYADEREKTLVAEAAKVSYVVLVGGILTVIAALGGLAFFSLFTQTSYNSYATAILLLSGVLMLSSISYGVKWCLGYRA